MKNIVGQIASKEDFYIRAKELRRIMLNLDAHANIQIAAPRRVGKSSILYYLKDNPSKGYINLYVEVESARSQNDFYRKIYREILKSEAIGSSRKFLDQLKNAKDEILSRLKGITLGGVGLELNDAEDIDFEEELTNLLIGINLGEDKLVLMIDEFPEVILNIVEDDKGEIINAKKFLQSNRELRNHPKLHRKVQFIYTGSNSLNLTVAHLDSTSLINDLASVPVEPLTNEQSEDFVQKILLTYKYTITPERLKYLVSIVEWNIPFYFQLIIQEITNQIEPDEELNQNVIDSSFAKVVEQRNDHYFEHYVRRLRRIFSESQTKFAHAFLNRLAQSASLSRNDAYNIAHELLDESESRRVLDSLIYDGYIMKITADGPPVYKFNSPILKLWWQNHEG